MSDFFRPLIRAIRQLSLREKFSYWGYVWLRVITNFLDIAGVAGVGLFGIMLASGVRGETEVEVLTFSANLESPETYLFLMLGVVAIFLLKSALAAFLLRANGLFLAQVETLRSAEILNSIYDGDLGKIDRMTASEIQWATGGSVRMAFGNLLVNLNVMISETSLFIFIFVTFAVVDFQTALAVTLYFAVLVGAYQLVIVQRLKRAGHQVRNAAVHAVTVTDDLFRAAKELLVWGRAENYVRIFSDSRLLEARTFARVRFFEGTPRYFVESALVIGVLGLVSWQLFSGDLVEGASTTAVFLAGGMRVMGALLPLQNSLTWISLNGPQAADALDALEGIKERGLRRNFDGINSRTEQDLASSDAGKESNLENPAILFDHVYYRHQGAEEDSLADVSLQVSAGSIVGVIGPSGAGKTTLVDLMLGLRTPSAGCIKVLSTSPKSLVEAHPGIVSYVPQRPGIVSGSIVRNVALGYETEKIDYAQALNCLKTVGLVDELKSRGSLDQILESPAAGLSGGQVQRLGLARALYSNPKVIVLDEATSALDAAAEAIMMRVVEQLKQSVTVIVIAHRLSTVQRVDNVFVLRDGALVGEGKFADVRRKLPFVEEYVRLMTIE